MRGLLARIAGRLRSTPPRPSILMYHRIAAPPVDPWGLSVRPDHFEEHLAVLRRRRPLLMSQFVEELDRGTLANDAVAVTFDDGYVDNVRRARPRLAAAGVPATLFVMTGALGTNVEYWWDELARRILLHERALDCDVEVDGAPFRLSFAADPAAGQGSNWRAWDPPRTEREATYFALWDRLRVSSAIARDRTMRQLREAVRSPPPHEHDLPMSEGDVAELAGDPAFEIGGHTVTHPFLPGLDPGERRQEILEGKLACERLAGRPVAGFAYPHGAFDHDCKAAVAECGFAWACSTESRPVTQSGEDRLALPRIWVRDCDGPTLARELNGGRS
jgi:peptidoglycan/xylan/chitin deacetylase (PgdA/CDA1 family)